MSTFLIVSSAVLQAPYDAFMQPPTLDISGLRTQLDWGDVTVEVPPGHHRVTVFIDTIAGPRVGAIIPVIVPPETGTRLVFAPPQAPGAPSMLRVEGQWPSDAAMEYYAAKDARLLIPSASSAPYLAGQHSATAWRSAASQLPAPSRTAAPAVPPVGPLPGSSGTVPATQPATPSAPSFGQLQSRHVEPARVREIGAQAGAPQLRGAEPRQAARNSVPPIPTPIEFARTQSEAHFGLRQGWYPDPYHRAELRWHDGERWTPSVMRAGQRMTDPV